MAGCGCGSGGKRAVLRNWYVIGTDGKIVSASADQPGVAYSSEMDARMASAQLPGSKVRPG